VAAFLIFLVFGSLVIAFLLTWRTSQTDAKYLFFEKKDLIEPETCCLMIDFPTYTYDEDNGTLVSYLPPFKIEGLLAVLGDYSAVVKNGGGIASELVPIYSTPFTSSDNRLTLKELDRDGTAHLVLMGKGLALRVGESWRADVSVDEGAYKGSHHMSLRNFGFLNKSRLYLPQQSTSSLLISEPLLMESIQASRISSIGSEH
jgi:hypothetical protein